MAATAHRPQRDEGWGDVVRDGFVGTVGKTPLIRLNSLSEATGWYEHALESKWTLRYLNSIFGLSNQ